MTARRTGLLAAGALATAAWIFALTRLWPHSIPAGLSLHHVDVKQLFDPALLRRTRDFTRFLQVESLLRQLTTIAVLAVYAKRGTRFVKESAAGPIGTGMLLGMLGLAIVWLVGLPFRLVEFWWVKDHGIVHTNWLAFIVGDYASLAGTFIAISLQLLVVMGFARLLARAWPLAALPVLVAIQLVLLLLTPFLLTDLHRLDSADLRADAARIAKVEGVHDVHVQVQDVHQDTTAPNAESIDALTGKHVILWDTLLRRGFTRREVDVVIAHEIGHLRHHDTLRSIGFSALMLIPLALLAEALTRRRGGLGKPETIPLALLIVVVFTFVTTPLTTAFSRRVEAAADWAALNATRDPDAASTLFKRFAPTALSEPTSPLWAHVLYDDHPTIEQRLAMVQAWEATQRR